MMFSKQSCTPHVYLSLDMFSYGASTLCHAVLYSNGPMSAKAAELFKALTANY